MNTSIRYENTINDLVAFQDDYLASTQMLRKQIRLLRICSGVALLLLSVGMILAGKSVPPPYPLLAALGGLFLFAPQLYRRSIRRSSLNLLREGDFAGIVGEHLVEVHPDGLMDRTAVNETKTFWTGIQRVSSTDTHTFLYTNSATAHIISYNGMSEGNLREFLHEVEQHRAFATRLPAA